MLRSGLIVQHLHLMKMNLVCQDLLNLLILYRHGSLSMLKLNTCTICDELIKASNCMNIVDAGKKKGSIAAVLSLSLSALHILEFADSLHCDLVNAGLVCALFFSFLGQSEC